MTDIGIIAIGRNEGERLRRCLASVLGRGMSVVYVDSNSTDGSATAAREMGAEVVNLDMSLPFSAARARNAGFERLMQIAPEARYVQFVDGDCEIVSTWIDAARKTLDSREDVAVVCGRRRERFPEKSLYNRLADVEWNSPIGEAKSCGGDAMMRVAAFKQAGGYDPTVVAGEEPELCQRLRAAGWKVLRIDAEMTLHDSAMFHFSQWWKRAVRSGYGAMDVATRFGKQGLFVSQVKSARWWAVYWTLTLVLWPTALSIIFALHAMQFGSAHSTGRLRFMVIAIGTLLWFTLLPLQMLKIAIRSRRRAGGLWTSIPYGILTMVAKWANVAGQRQYLRDRAAGRHARLIEYKEASTNRTNEHELKSPQTIF